MNAIVNEFTKSCRVNVKKGLTLISPTLASKIIYKKVFKKSLNLDNPKLFNEKIQWLKLNWQHPLIAKCADKYLVREYINECGCEEILNEIYEVYSNVEDINFEKLPKSFVLKCTHGCATNILCKNKTEIKEQEIRNQLSKWLKSRYSLFAAEIQYDRIEPRIICEKFLESDEEYGLIDYKIYCFNGEPKYILVCKERQKDIKKYFYDTNWNMINYRRDCNEDSIGIKKPKSLNQMLEYSKKLSKEFPFVRADFYEVDSKPVFGELTFTPAGGLSPEYTDEGEKVLGELINLPEYIIK